MYTLALTSLFLATSTTTHAKTITINNTSPRLDVNGNIVDGHDLSLRVLPDGTYLATTIEYGLCVAPTGQGCDQTPDHCGLRSNHNITIWSSPDLTSGSWTKHGDAFPLSSRPPGLIFRPDAIFNPNTQLWVLWYNYAGVGGNTYMTSTATSPYGPYKGFAKSNCTDDTWTGGDFHLFTDSNQGYVIWTGMSKAAGLDHKIRISKLTPDFLSVTNDPPYMFDDFKFNEAPSIFVRNGIWYALFGHCSYTPALETILLRVNLMPRPLPSHSLTHPHTPTHSHSSGCCFCYQGSGLFVHTAPNPMGPWTLQSTPTNDISCQAPSLVEQLGGIPTPGQGCLYGGSTDVAVTRSQQDFLATLPDGKGGETFLYIGSRWGQSPDGIKGHEPQYVFPLSFNEDGTINHITWNDTVTFDVAA